jgi:glycine dehydrogenase
MASMDLVYHEDLIRKSPFMTHAVFAANRSETSMMRYLKSLEKKDLGLDQAMIPLGSCTMKLNAAAEMMPITWPEFSGLHPFAPADQAKGYAQIFKEMEKALAEITGFAAVSLQPNAGSQGEYAGLVVIRAYHHDRGEGHRKVVLIPASAHGTNPASAVMAGFDVVVVACDKSGHIDFADLKAKAQEHSANLAALMITYPSTYGVFEDNVREVCRLIHRHGGQVYMDGANLNAQVGLTSPGLIGADVCHMNLHKTFAIPHGGGGPGMGPIAVAKHLAPFLPRHPLARVGGAKGVPAVSAAPWGSASILLISYGYLRMLGGHGMTEATRMAILNANYIKARLQDHYEVHYVGIARSGRARDDLRPAPAEGAVGHRRDGRGEAADGLRVPRAHRVVAGARHDDDRAHRERAEGGTGPVLRRHDRHPRRDPGRDRRRPGPLDNPLKHAPHTAQAVCADRWPHAYSRERAAYPMPGLRANKFWPSVSRIDNPYGDKNLVCSCPDVQQYVTP